MTIYELNILALKRIHPDFIIPVKTSTESNTGIEILSARSGDPTAQWEGILLHSRLDPRREARRLIADTGEHDCVVFFGFGLGYYVEEYLALYPAATVIIVEPDSGFFKTALGVRDLTAVLASPNVSLLLDVQPDTLASVLNTYLYTAISVIAPRSIVRLYEEYFMNLQAVIDAFTARREINRNTLKRFGKRWVRNLAANISHLPSAGRLHSLTGRRPAGERLPSCRCGRCDRARHQLDLTVSRLTERVHKLWAQARIGKKHVIVRSRRVKRR